MSYEVEKTDEQWQAELTPSEYQVLRLAGTEPAFRGEYTDTKTEGVYSCRGCGSELFRSSEKFDSHCGWPSFFDPKDSEAVELIADTSHGMVRTEVRCATLRLPPGPRLRGRGLPDPDGPAVLHQQHLPAPDPDGGLTARSAAPEHVRQDGPHRTPVGAVPVPRPATRGGRPVPPARACRDDRLRSNAGPVTAS